MLIKFNEYNILINNDANNNINNLMNNLSNDNIDIQLDNVSTIIFNQFNMLDDYIKNKGNQKNNINNIEINNLNKKNLIL